MTTEMKTNEKIIAAAIVAVAIVVLGFALRSGIVTFKSMDRSVTVKGLSEREVKADKVTWPLVYKELGNDPAEMYDLLTQKNKNNYSNEIMNYRYRATSVITVISSDVDKVRTLMRRQSELMKEGIALISDEYGGNSVVYEFTGLNKVKPDMVEEATKNARATAQKFADDSGSELGAIRNAQQGQFSIEDRDANSPYIKRLRVVNTVEYSIE